jgi:hypothetical protein
VKKKKAQRELKQRISASKIKKFPTIMTKLLKLKTVGVIKLIN